MFFVLIADEIWLDLVFAWETLQVWWATLGQRKDLVEAVGGVAAKGFVGDQVQIVEVMESLAQVVFMDAHGGSNAVLSIPAYALWVGDQA